MTQTILDEIEEFLFRPEFKNEAVRLITDEGRSMAEVARNLGINAPMLDRWKRDGMR